MRGTRASQPGHHALTVHRPPAPSGTAHPAGRPAAGSRRAQVHGILIEQYARG
jgi:hypothetical protein